MLHAWEKYGLDAAQKEFTTRYADECQNKARLPSFEKRLRGSIAYIGQIRGRDDGLYVRLLHKYHTLKGTPIIGTLPAMRNNTMKRDVFICHASEDKHHVVDPLVKALAAAGISVWYDKAEIRWGDSLTAKVNEGLATSRYVIVVISPSFMAKQWPKKELASALNREINSGETSVLPLMVGSAEQIASSQSQLPLQADKLYRHWAGNPSAIADEIKMILDRSA